MFTIGPAAWGSKFSPIPLSGLVGWWDVSDAANRTLDGTNTKVIGLSDKSGNGKNFAFVSGTQPTYNAPGTKFSIGSMTGGDLDLASSISVTSSTLVTAFSWVTTGASTLIAPLRSTNTWSSGSGYGFAIFSGPGNAGYPQVSTPTQSTGTSVTNGSVISSNKHTVSHSIGALSNSGTFRLDGTAVTPSPFGSATSTAFTFTKYAGAETSYAANGGAIGEWCLYNRQLTTTELQQIEAYLKAKWSTI